MGRLFSRNGLWWVGGVCKPILLFSLTQADQNPTGLSSYYALLAGLDDSALLAKSHSSRLSKEFFVYMLYCVTNIVLFRKIPALSVSQD